MEKSGGGINHRQIYFLQFLNRFEITGMPRHILTYPQYYGSTKWRIFRYSCTALKSKIISLQTGKRYISIHTAWLLRFCDTWERPTGIPINICGVKTPIEAIKNMIRGSKKFKMANAKPGICIKIISKCSKHTSIQKSSEIRKAAPCMN